MPAASIRVQLLVIAFCLPLSTPSASAQGSIEFRDLGTPAGTVGSAARAINNRGQVVGEAALPVGPIVVFVPFLWSPKSGFDLILADTRGGAVDINDHGDVVGTFLSGEESHGFFWNVRSGLADLGANLQPVAINNRGQVAGECILSGIRRACLWDKGVLVPLEIPFGDLVFVADINSRGQVIGFSCTETCTGWIWTPNKGAAAFRVYPEGINNRGQTVGRLLSSSNGVVVSRDGTIIRQTSSRFAWFAINSRGWAVGVGLPPSEQGEFATLWYPNGTIVTLPGPEESAAIDINERREIAGTAAFTPSDVHAVIWTVRGAPKK
jgi:uncharacterized membrane protein